MFDCTEMIHIMSHLPEMKPYIQSIVLMTALKNQNIILVKTILRHYGKEFTESIWNQCDIGAKDGPPELQQIINKYQYRF